MGGSKALWRERGGDQRFYSGSFLRGWFRVDIFRNDEVSGKSQTSGSGP
jgi:hypothetical protein